MMKHVTIYTDGACSGNPGPGGWGAILQYGSAEKELSGGEYQTTNNRMELLGVINALQALRNKIRVSHFSLVKSSGVRLLPYEKSKLVASIKEKLVIRVMAGANTVCADVAKQCQIPHHCLKGNGAAKRIIFFVAVEAEYSYRLFVKEYPLTVDTYNSEAYSFA